MLNKKRIRAVLEVLEAHPERHHQGAWLQGADDTMLEHLSGRGPLQDCVVDLGHHGLSRYAVPDPSDWPCGTTMCIAGYTCLMYDREGMQRYKDEQRGGLYPFGAKGASLLGLCYKQSDDIFYDTDPESALAKLRSLLDTEEA